MEWVSKNIFKIFGIASGKFSTQVVSDNDSITNYISEEYQSSCKTIAYGGDHAFVAMASVKLDDIFDASDPLHYLFVESSLKTMSI